MSESVGRPQLHRLGTVSGSRRAIWEPAGLRPRMDNLMGFTSSRSVSHRWSTHSPGATKHFRALTEWRRGRSSLEPAALNAGGASPHSSPPVCPRLP